jgi:signal transduction histidine kinase
MKKFSIAISWMFLILFGTGLGCAVSFLTFDLIGAPPDSAYLGYLIVSAISILYFLLSIVVEKYSTKDQNAPIKTKILNEFDKLSIGDFGVVLPKGKYRLYSNFVGRIRNLAENLKTQETNRRDFISEVSQKFQSSISFITDIQNILSSKNLQEEERLRYLEMIESETQRLSSLSDDLFKLQKLDVAQSEKTYTSEVIE